MKTCLRSSVLTLVGFAAALGFQALACGTVADEPQVDNASDADSRSLPTQTESQKQAAAAVQPGGVETLDPYTPPSEIAARAFGDPPDAKRLSGRNLWIDRERNRVIADGYVAMREGPLEMFACGAGTKEHESVVGVIPEASEMHAALLAIGAQVGTSVRFHPRYVPATGQRIRIWVMWPAEETEGEAKPYHVTDARQWVLHRKPPKRPMETDWVFAGSQIWEDSDGTTHYSADGGDMICVSNFASAMLDVPVSSSAQAGQLLYEPNTEKIPPPRTPLRLVLEPIPVHDGRGEVKLPSKPDPKTVFPAE